MAISVSLVPSELSTGPGGSVTGEVRLSSTGPGNRTVHLHVGGAAALWSWVVPSEIEVTPGTGAVVSFGFRLPRGSQAPAGPVPFTLEATTDEDEGDGTGRAEGTLIVTPFSEVTLHLDPVTSSGGRSGQHRVVVENQGNVAVETRLGASTNQPGMEIAIEPGTVRPQPGQEATATVTVRAGGARLRGARSLPFVVTATPDQGQAVEVQGALRQTGFLSGPATGAILVAVVVLVLLVTLGTIVFSSGDEPDRVVAGAGTPTSTTPVPPSTIDPNCTATGHVDTRVTGLTPEDIPTLPEDFSFFYLADDRCTPIRWNPCEPVHYIINPANAPPTGIADVREAFSRLSQATGMTYIDDGMTDEAGQRREAYQPERYGERWAPILVHWETTSSRSTETVEIVGGGFPTRAGDVYVTGNLFLNSGAYTNERTRAPLEGGFGAELGLGPIGAEGVTWGRVILHEMGHLMGLGHVRDPAQLMYPETTDHTIRPGKFGPGDLAGLRLLGKDAGCLPTPPLDTPTRGRGGNRQP